MEVYLRLLATVDKWGVAGVARNTICSREERIMGCKASSMLNRIGVVLLGAALAALLMTAPAFASEADSDKVPVGPVTTTDSYITAAASRAAGPAPEILGLASVEESGQFVDTSSYYSWAKPKYYLAASYYNMTPSPFLANLATGLGTKAILNTSRSGSGAGPNASLNPEDETDKQVLDLADVVIGNGNGADVSAVAYSFKDYSGLASTMDNIAAAADDAVAAEKEEFEAGVKDFARTLRYGDSATIISTNYRKYIYGTMGIVQKALDDGVVSKKSVAVVQNYYYDDDQKCYVFDLMKTVEAGQDGTASTNRYLETTANTGINGITLASNYADTKEIVTAEDLANVDLIMVGGQQNSSNYSAIIDGLTKASLLGKTYFVKDNGSAGAMYGVVMNSVENAQNIGRILGMLYPTVVDQQNWIAYYYESFYHINKTDLVVIMHNAMTGVRCAAVKNPTTAEEAVAWSESNSGYKSGSDQSSVASMISDGYSYYLAKTGLSK